VALTTVQGQIVDASYTPTAGIVHLRLVTSTDGTRPPGITTGGVLIIADVHPVVDEDGLWSAALQSNDVITPAASWYQVIAQASRAPGSSVQEPATVLNIVVPPSGGPYFVEELLVTPPAALAGAHSHSAAQTSFAPGGTVTATNVEDAILEVAAEAGGSSDLSLVFAVSPAIDPWVIPHNFGRPPNLDVYLDTGARAYWRGRDDSDPNTTVLTWGIPRAGMGIAS
jgi:hypothetical protein